VNDQLAIDYAWQHPDPAAIRAAGYTAVLRYLSNDATKDLTAAEAAQLGSVGLGVGVIWETMANRSLGSTVAGQQDGGDVRLRLNELRAPGGLPVLVALGDFQVQPYQLGAIKAYYAAYRATLGEYQPGAGGYGPGWLIDQLAAIWPDDIWWQNAIDDEGVSGSTVVAAASIYQRIRPTRALNAAAGSYDEDVYGFGPRPLLSWWQPGAAAPPSPPPVTDWITGMPVVRQGDTGPVVRTVQGLLLARSYVIGHTGQLGVGLDGQFGPLTDAAVRNLQAAARITIDGIVGPQTWPVLAGA